MQMGRMGAEAPSTHSVRASMAIYLERYAGR